MNNELKIGQGLGHQLEQAFARNDWTEQQVHQASGGDFLGNVRLVLEGRAKITPIEMETSGIITPVTSDTRRRIIVDYGMSWNKMLSAGNYDWKNDSITASKFPVKGKGKVEFETEEFWFNRNILSEDVVKHIKDADASNPWIPAQTEHTFAYGAQHPEQQRKYPIIGLGSVAGVSFGRIVLDLYRGDSERRLSLSGWGGDWDAVCRFLAVRIIPKT